MISDRWPYPGDSPLARARKIAQAYRAHLHTVNPQICATVDDMAKAFGEAWVAPRLLTVPDDGAVLTAGEAADYMCVTTAAIRRLRLSGRLHGEKVDGQWLYRIEDLHSLQASPRRRKTGVDHRAA